MKTTRLSSSSRLSSVIALAALGWSARSNSFGFWNMPAVEVNPRTNIKGTSKGSFKQNARKSSKKKRK